MFQDLTSLVLDIGTAKSKIGYGGDDAPRLIANSYVGQNNSMEIEGAQNQKYIVGDKYLNMDREDREIHSIFKHREAERCEIDFEKYEAFVENMLSNELQVELKNYSVLLSEDISFQPHQLKSNRAKITQFMLQNLEVANVYFLKNPVLSCFATGRSTALVCDSGDLYTKIAAVHDGYCLHKTAKSLPFGGASLSRHLRKVVQQKCGGGQIPLNFGSGSSKAPHSFKQFHTQQLLHDIKQSFSSRHQQQQNQPQNIQISQESTQELAQIQYELPDRRTISIKRSQIKDDIMNPYGNPPAGSVAESSSAPQLIVKGYNYRGIPHAIADNVNSCDIDIKKELYSNLLITGGNSLYSNTMQQIVSKVSELAPPNAKVKGVAMVAPQQRAYCNWIGGSIVTSLSSFQSYWVGKEQWKEHGINIIEKKCT